MIQFLEKIGNKFLSLTISSKISIMDIRQDPKYSSGCEENKSKIKCHVILLSPRYY